MSLRLPGQRRMMLVVVLAGAAFVLFFPSRQLIAQRAHISDLERRLVELRTENQMLDEDVARLTDPAELETLARERLGLVRPGERAYVVDPVPPKVSRRPCGSRAGPADSRDGRAGLGPGGPRTGTGAK
jgi:cell division protein FtsB